MDQRLLAWARAVKHRQRSKLPVLWLFTDTIRLSDPLPAIAALPKGSGVVFRHDDDPNRGRLGAAIAKLCRARRIALVVAGDARLAAKLKAGLHLRGGRRAGFIWMNGRLVTSSAHNSAELRNARRIGAQIAFLSPAFKSASHPDARVLGPVKWQNLARKANPLKAYALGGVNSCTIMSLSDFCGGAAAISALKA